MNVGDWYLLGGDDAWLRTKVLDVSEGQADGRHTCVCV